MLAGYFILPPYRFLQRLGRYSDKYPVVYRLSCSAGCDYHTAHFYQSFLPSALAPVRFGSYLAPHIWFTPADSRVLFFKNLVKFGRLPQSPVRVLKFWQLIFLIAGFIAHPSVHPLLMLTFRPRENLWSQVETPLSFGCHFINRHLRDQPTPNLTCQGTTSFARYVPQKPLQKVDLMCALTIAWQLLMLLAMTDLLTNSRWWQIGCFHDFSQAPGPGHGACSTSNVRKGH